MASGQEDYTVRIVSDDAQADQKVAIVDDQVIEVGGAATGDFIVSTGNNGWTTRPLADADIPAAIARDAEVATAYVPKALYDANTVLAANSDDTPAAVTMGASTILARLAAGNIKAATPAEVLTLLNAVEHVAPDFKTSGLTGAVAAARFVGATTSGAPVTGTFAVGDFIVDQSGQMWVCTVAGSPGTWMPQTLIGTAAALAAANPVVAAGRLVYASDTGDVKVGNGTTAYNSLGTIRNLTAPQRATSTAAQTGITATTDITSLSVTFTVGSVPWKVDVYVPYIAAVTNSAIGNVYLTDAANSVTSQRAFDLTAAGKIASTTVVEYISTPGTYTRKARIGRVSGSGTITVLGDVAVLTAYINAEPDR